MKRPKGAERQNSCDREKRRQRRQECVSSVTVCFWITPRAGGDVCAEYALPGKEDSTREREEIEIEICFFPNTDVEELGGRGGGTKSERRRRRRLSRGALSVIFRSGAGVRQGVRASARVRTRIPSVRARPTAMACHTAKVLFCGQKALRATQLLLHVTYRTMMVKTRYHSSTRPAITLYTLRCTHTHARNAAWRCHIRIRAVRVRAR